MPRPSIRHVDGGAATAARERSGTCGPDVTTRRLAFAVRLRPSRPARRRSVPDRIPRQLPAIGGVVGPAAFVAAWSILGARTAGYSPTDDAISRLAATGAPTHAAMTAGLVAFGTGLPAFGLALRRTMAGPAWALATATGIAALGVAATPLGSPGRDGVHGAFAAVGYATLAGLPLAAVRPLAAQGRTGWARWSTLAGAASAASLAATLLGPRHGLFQRVGLTIGDAWVVATALGILRHDQP
ncbi:MAG TPA: DUF998 domain-containing protein [Acidimicrobiales bacterium]|nr:DUF998 domain-containing protein [Acidimicrobiales bacterium]